jgi:Tfp pilus assembly protein PilV
MLCTSVWRNPRSRSGRRNRPIQGLTLFEVILALFIFLMMSLMFSAVVPTAARSARYSNSYNYAVALCQRKVDQLQEAGWGKLNETDLRSLGIIDATPEATDGAAKIYSFTSNISATNPNNADNIAQYFPGGTNAATRPTGTIRVEPWTPSTVYIGGSPQDTLKRVTVTIAWRDARGAPSSFSISSLITRMTLN